MMAWSAGGASSAWIGPVASAMARARQADQRCIHAPCVRVARLARSTRPEDRPGRFTLPLAAVRFLVGVRVVVDVAVLVAILAGLQVAALTALAATLTAALATALAAA